MMGAGVGVLAGRWKGVRGMQNIIILTAAIPSF